MKLVSLFFTASTLYFRFYIKDNRYWIIIIATKGAMLEFIVSFAKKNNNLFKIHAE